MIAVIADDITGAAEVGGVGINHGLNTVIQTFPEPPADGVDLLVIASDTRSKSLAEAKQETIRILHALLPLRPEMIFKKIDSVLRGHVLTELEVLMEETGCNKALVVAGNPLLKRYIRNGTYYIGKDPINLTGFANDPNFPAFTSNVIELLGGSADIFSKSPDQDLNVGINVGDVTNKRDLAKWVAKIDNQTLSVGGSAFFKAMIDKQKPKLTPKKNGDIKPRQLIVHGSLYPKPDSLIKTLQSLNYRSSNMPKEVYLNKDPGSFAMNDWIDSVATDIAAGQNVVLTMDHEGNPEPGLTSRLVRELGRVVVGVTSLVEFDELLVEGGQTLAAILDALEISQLVPVNEFAPGVIRMKPVGPYPFYITSKPGSYLWPERLFKQNINLTTES